MGGVCGVFVYVVGVWWGEWVWGVGWCRLAASISREEPQLRCVRGVVARGGAGLNIGAVGEKIGRSRHFVGVKGEGVGVVERVGLNAGALGERSSLALVLRLITRFLASYCGLNSTSSFVLYRADS